MKFAANAFSSKNGMPAVDYEEVLQNSELIKELKKEIEEYKKFSEIMKPSIDRNQEDIDKFRSMLRSF